MNLGRVLRRPVYSLVPFASRLSTTACTPQYSVHTTPHTREYSSSPAKAATGWIKRKLLTAITLIGLSGGALIIVSLIIKTLNNFTSVIV